MSLAVLDIAFAYQCQLTSMVAPLALEVSPPTDALPLFLTYLRGNYIPHMQQPRLQYRFSAFIER